MRRFSLDALQYQVDSRRMQLGRGEALCDLLDLFNPTADGQCLQWYQCRYFHWYFPWCMIKRRCLCSCQGFNDAALEWIVLAEVLRALLLDRLLGHRLCSGEREMHIMTDDMNLLGRATIGELATLQLVAEAYWILASDEHDLEVGRHGSVSRE